MAQIGCCVFGRCCDWILLARLLRPPNAAHICDMDLFSNISCKRFCTKFVEKSLLQNIAYSIIPRFLGSLTFFASEF